jgi:hypothetical protein
MLNGKEAFRTDGDGMPLGGPGYAGRERAAVAAHEIQRTSSVHIILLLFLCFSFAACGSGTASTTSLNMTGFWTITTESAVNSNLHITAEGTISQTGAAISGVLVISGIGCATNPITLTGSLKGNTVDITLDESGQDQILTGTVSSNAESASGTYTTVVSAACGQADHGKWSAVKTTAPSGIFVGELVTQDSLPVQMVVTLRAEGNRVTGTAGATNSMCFSNLTIDGRSTGPNLELSATDESGSVLSLKGSLEPAGNTIRLNASGACVEDGTLTLHRISK